MYAYFFIGILIIYFDRVGHGCGLTADPETNIVSAVSKAVAAAFIRLITRARVVGESFSESR